MLAVMPTACAIAARSSFSSRAAAAIAPKAPIVPDVWKPCL